MIMVNNNYEDIVKISFLNFTSTIVFCGNTIFELNFHNCILWKFLRGVQIIERFKFLEMFKFLRGVQIFRRVQIFREVQIVSENTIVETQLYFVETQLLNCTSNF